MIQSIIHRLLLRRHFWRYASFSEVAELYASRMLRMVAVYMSAAFISIYLYQNDYSVEFITLYWSAYYAFKAVVALPLASYAARFGPKHGILLSNLLYIPSMIAFTLVPQYGIYAMIFTGSLQAISSTLYSMAYYIDFSKVKTPAHAGKEIAYMNIFEKVATGLSPLIGGVVAVIAGPNATMWFAAAFFAFAAVPLFRTGELEENDHRLVFRGFPWRMAARSLVAKLGLGVDAVASGTPWTLLIAIVIVGMSQGNKVYAIIGGLTSLIVVADVVFSYAYGVLIDRKKGGALLKFGLIGDVVTHLARPFVQTVFSVGAVNVANEATTTGYMMAFTRGVFDVADRTGHRATYIGLGEVAMDIGATVASLTVFGLVATYGVELGLRSFFAVAAVAMLVVLVAKFPLYRR